MQEVGSGEFHLDLILELALVIELPLSLHLLPVLKTESRHFDSLPAPLLEFLLDLKR
jgi:hypothetical protein